LQGNFSSRVFIKASCCLLGTRPSLVIRLRALHLQTRIMGSTTLQRDLPPLGKSARTLTAYPPNKLPLLLITKCRRLSCGLGAKHLNTWLQRIGNLPADPRDHERVLVDDRSPLVTAPDTAEAIPIGVTPDVGVHRWKAHPRVLDLKAKSGARPRDMRFACSY